MATILHQMMPAFDLMSFWYHFAIMFEALFILTAVDAGTRVARFMLQDTLGNFFPRFNDHNWRVGAWITTAVMVAGWGGILILGVTDPLGGINTFYPLFGIANQLLAAVALAVCLAIAANKGKFKYLWIIALPLAFDLVVTVVGSWQKIFSSNPKVGYWANHFAFKEALNSGAESFGAAKTPEAIEAVVRNTMVQGTLSIIFVLLALVVVVMAIIEVIRSYQGHTKESCEDPYVESRLFAPAGLTATAAEKDVEKQWAEYYRKHPEEIAGSASQSAH